MATYKYDKGDISTAATIVEKFEEKYRQQGKLWKKQGTVGNGF
jgi:hypothetical protein